MGSLTVQRKMNLYLIKGCQTDLWKNKKV